MVAFIGQIPQHSYANLTSNRDSGALNCALQVWPALTGQASVQVPVVITSPACRSGALGQLRSSCMK